MKEWFVQLNQREQISVLLLSLAVILYTLFIFVLSPLDSKRDALALQNAAVAESLTRVDGMVSELLQLRGNGAKTGAKRNLTSLVNQSTRRLQLSVSRLQPNSRGDIQVRMENAVFDDVLQWLHDMELREGLLVRELSVTQTGAAGRVNATVRVAQAG